MAKIKIQHHILTFLIRKKAAYFEDIVSYVHEHVHGVERVALSYRIKRTLKKLASDGDIVLQMMNDRTFAFITPQGRHKERSLRLSSDTRMMSMAWDGKWRIIMLDVPESDKEKRNALRYLLKKADFVCLKNSVWISPYPYEHMFEEMKNDLKLTNEIMIVVTDSLDAETERAFRECFWM